MRPIYPIGIVVTLLGFVAPARGGITVSSYGASALTNAYAPLDRSAYFNEQDANNISPALADVSADWTGTNIAGATTTWHWAGSAHAVSTTTFDGKSLSLTGAGSFSYDLTTTAGF